MSLASWFQNASAAKKIGAVTLALVNAFTLVNSVTVGHKTLSMDLSGEPVPDYSPAANILLAPALTGATWILSEEADESPIGSTPVSLVANQTKNILPKSADTALGVTVAAVGAPGAWVGQTVGTVTGLSSGVILALKPNNP